MPMHTLTHLQIIDRVIEWQRQAHGICGRVRGDAEVTSVFRRDDSHSSVQADVGVRVRVQGNPGCPNVLGEFNLTSERRHFDQVLLVRNTQS